LILKCLEVLSEICCFLRTVKIMILSRYRPHYLFLVIVTNRDIIVTLPFLTVPNRPSPSLFVLHRPSSSFTVSHRSSFTVPLRPSPSLFVLHRPSSSFTVPLRPSPSHTIQHRSSPFKTTF
jgi:hypothetical protein